MPPPEKNLLATPWRNPQLPYPWKKNFWCPCAVTVIIILPILMQWVLQMRHCQLYLNLQEKSSLRKYFAVNVFFTTFWYNDQCAVHHKQDVCTGWHTYVSIKNMQYNRVIMGYEWSRLLLAATMCKMLSSLGSPIARVASVWIKNWLASPSSSSRESRCSACNQTVLVIDQMKKQSMETATHMYLACFIAEHNLALTQAKPLLSPVPSRAP